MSAPVDKAKKVVEEAKQAGSDAVKKVKEQAGEAMKKVVPEEDSGHSG